MSAGDRSRSCNYRKGGWSIYFLGQLAAELAPALLAESIDVVASCYTYGTRPDTILNFGMLRPEYMEINYSGRLNLKVSLDKDQPESARGEIVDQVIQKWRMAPFASNVAVRFHPTGKVGASKTVMSFDVGLAAHEDGLVFAQSRQETLGRLLSVLRVFYGTRGDAGAPNPPMQPTGAAGG